MPLSLPCPPSWALISPREQCWWLWGRWCRTWSPSKRTWPGGCGCLRTDCAPEKCSESSCPPSARTPEFHYPRKRAILHLHTGFRLAFSASLPVSLLPCPSFLFMKPITGFLINKVWGFHLKLAETRQCAIFLSFFLLRPIRKMAENSSKCLEKIIVNTEIYTTWS